MRLHKDGPIANLLRVTHEREREGAPPPRPAHTVLSVLTGQVAAQSLHGGLDRGVMDLSQLFNHRHHRHTACGREDRVSSVARKTVLDSPGRERGNACIPTLPKQRAFVGHSPLKLYCGHNSL